MTVISFKTFLNEQNTRHIDDAEEVIHRIKTDCAKFLNEIDFYVGPGVESAAYINNTTVPRALWRGMTLLNTEFVKLQGDRTRTPSDTSPYMHRLLVDHLNKQFGWPYRHSGVFCSSARSQAYSYGDNLFLVFPIGDYSYVYSPKIQDAYQSFDNHTNPDGPKMMEEILSAMGKTAAEFDGDMEDEDYYRKWFNLVYEYLEKYKPYTDKYLKHVLDSNSALQNGIEIVVKCDSYYALNVLPQDEHTKVIKQVLLGISK